MAGCYSPFHWWQAVPRYAWAAVGLNYCAGCSAGGVAGCRLLAQRAEARQQKNLALARAASRRWRLITHEFAIRSGALLGVEAYRARPGTEAFLRNGSLLSNHF